MPGTGAALFQLDGTGVTDIPNVADQLAMVRDGAMVSGHLGDPGTVASRYDAARAVIGFRG
jgi:hypothetical protein